MKYLEPRQPKLITATEMATTSTGSAAEVFSEATGVLSGFRLREEKHMPPAYQHSGGEDAAPDDGLWRGSVVVGEFCQRSDHSKSDRAAYCVESAAQQDRMRKAPGGFRACDRGIGYHLRMRCIPRSYRGLRWRGYFRVIFSKKGVDSPRQPAIN